MNNSDHYRLLLFTFTTNPSFASIFSFLDFHPDFMHQYKFSSFVFTPHSLSLSNSEGAVELRPKSAQLLKYLIENKQIVCNKDKLLEVIWSESVVSEGVVYDAIKELRQVLGDSPKTSHFIQTFPKKGYQWICPCELTNITKTPRKKNLKLFRQLSQYWLMYTLIAIMGVSLWYFGARFSQPNNPHSIVKSVNPKALVVVLPFINQTVHKNANWITNGLMEMLENNLAYQDSFYTYPSIDVIALSEHYIKEPDIKVNEAEIERISKATNADYVISTVISGQPDNYQAEAIIYTTGVPLAASQKVSSQATGELITQLSFQLTDRLVRSDSLIDRFESISHDDFTVRALAEGNQAFLSRKYAHAKHYYEIVKQRFPDFLIGGYRLAKTELELGNIKSARKNLDKLMMKSELDKNKLLKARVLMLLGKINYYQQAFVIAEEQFNESQQIFNSLNEKKWVAWLYILNSRVAQMTQRNQQSAQLLYQALSIYKQINHRLGEGWTLEFLAQLSQAENNIEQAKLLLERSKIVRSRAGNQLGVAATLVKLGNLELLTDDKKSLKCFTQALEIYQLIGDRLAEQKALQALSGYWLTKNDHKKSQFYIDRMYLNAKILENEKLKLDAGSAEVRLLLAQQNLIGAKEKVTSMLEVSRHLGYSMLTKVYENYLLEISQATEEKPSLSAKLNLAI